MEIEYANSYTEHGCNIHGKLAIVRYNQHVTNFNGAYGAHKRGGLYDYLDKAKELIKEKHPNHALALSIPDLVVKILD